MTIEPPLAPRVSPTSATMLITGATGQIGRWLLHRLLQLAPETRLVLALRDPEPQLATLRAWLATRGIPRPVLESLQTAPYRLEDTVTAQALIGRLRPGVVLHLAARFEWGLSHAEAHRAQVQATQALWDAQTDPRGHAGRFIALGGYMTQHRPHLERLGMAGTGTPDWARLYRRVGGYEASKLETQAHMSARASRLGRPWLCVHPATVCGHSVEGELPRHAALHALCRQLLRGRLSALPGSRRHQLPLVSVDHLADFLAHLALDSDILTGDYLLLDRSSPSFHALVHQLAAALSVRAPRLALPLPLMRAVLRLPGMAAWSGASAEGLDFLLEAPQFDTAAADALARRWQLQAAPLDAALTATARFVRQEARA